MHDTEDKQWWCEHTANKDEIEFVEQIAPRLDLDIIINPQKENNKTAPDLLWNGQLAELKSPRTPFFMAKKYFNIPADWAVTFNTKDYHRYIALYPEIPILFHVRWEQLKKKIHGKIYTVNPIEGVWETSIQQINQFVKDGAKIHTYWKRINDKRGNAKASLGLDLRKMKCHMRKGG